MFDLVSFLKELHGGELVCEFGFTVYINNITHGRHDSAYQIFVGQRERMIGLEMHWRTWENKNRNELQRNRT
jgi:hypothetical protein